LYERYKVTMTRIAASEVRRDFADAVNRVAYRGERIVLHRRGRDLAALVPIEDLELLRELEDRLDLEAARAALAEAKRRGTKPWKTLKAELGL
jgi:prevent-host-death family protein